MAANSSAETVSKLGVGIGVGFALYFLIRNLGFGREGGEARGEGAPVPPSVLVPPSVPMPRDAQRLEFVMIGPTTSDDKTSAFRGPGNTIYSLEELIARIKAGGRTDMILKVRGDVISGPANAAEAAIKRAGIDLWKPAPPSLFSDPVKNVSGSARAQYVTRSVVGRGIYR